ncbi:MAG: gluconate 5-dehydrogenase [Betaproteobacteria bacterium RIFCSPLOWO2_12_FULL_64_23]|nr:MAG: gluconate 5-dehydrogenase [Betaproteobacteria bacterium RIFCSPLOWO2_12_FULL_64_23]
MSVRKLFDLTGKVVLITGGSRGLGLQIAEALGEMGAKLALTARKADELAQAKEHLQRMQVQVFTLPCDHSKAASIQPVIENIMRHYGQIDVLINNAGTTWGAPAEEHPLEAWEKVMNLNVTGLFLTTQLVGRLSMIPRRYGRIVNIASVAGLLGNDLRIQRSLAYNTSKGAVVNLTRALAAEWGQYNITVNAIAPGFFPSKMTRFVLGQIGDAAIAQTPLARLGGEEDLKGLAALFASDASAHITGQIVAVDGGASII